MTLTRLFLRTGRRRLHPHTHEALDHLLLAGAVAAGTGLDLPVGRTGAMTGGTVLNSGGGDLLFAAEGRLLKGQLQPGHDILAPAGGILAGAPGGCSAAEEITEDVPEATKVSEAAAEATGPGVGVKVGVHTGEAVGIVPGPLVGVGQDLVGLAYLLELLLGGFIAGVPVRMVFHCQLPVSLFDIIGTGAFVNAQHLIIVSFIFCHCFSPR